MISGESPLTPVETIRASGVSPSSAALTSLITTSAAAPSFSGQQFPAVTVPCSRNTGLRVAIFSSVVPGRGPSSAATTEPSGSVTGVISRCQKPLASAFSARFCDRTPNSSCSSRVMPRDSATFSAVCAHRDVDVGQLAVVRGSCHGDSASAVAAVRAFATSKAGFCVSGSESLLPLANRETHSTPPEMNTSPSPALIAWYAIRVDCSEEEQ